MLLERRPCASLLNSGSTRGFGTSNPTGINTSPKSTYWNVLNVQQINNFTIRNKSNISWHRFVLVFYSVFFYSQGKQSICLFIDFAGSIKIKINIPIVWIHSDCVSFIEINSWLHVLQENGTHLVALIFMLKNRNRTKATLLHVIEFFNEYSMLLKWIRSHISLCRNFTWCKHIPLQGQIVIERIIRRQSEIVRCLMMKCQGKSVDIGTQSAAVKKTVPWNPILLLSLVKWVFEIFGTAPLSSPIPYYTQRRPFCSVNA